MPDYVRPEAVTEAAMPLEPLAVRAQPINRDTNSGAGEHGRARFRPAWLRPYPQPFASDFKFGRGLITIQKGREAYPPGECRLPWVTRAGDLSGACTSAVKIGGGLRDGDHHRR